jgi:hypothetical protein
MSIHKLTAGSGYDYLTRQVAAQDATEKGAASLASYYAEKGESPGRWVGSGLAGLDGLAEGDVVTAQQMKALFGSGRHPLSEEMRARLQGPGLTAKDFDLISRLGVPYKVYANDVSAFRLEVAKRVAELNRGAGLPAATPGSIQDRARVRSEVASEFFHAEFGRAPRDAREIAATIAKHSRPKTTAVAGYDLTFRPVKSVSTLWALADPSMSAAIESAHDAAVKDALDFIEARALFTRTGTNGVRQVDVAGLIAAAFTHRDSRAGDPLLHTHVAVANKVQTLDGRWLAIDGRVLFKATVAASETYNTAIERRLGDALGVRFAERPAASAAGHMRCSSCATRRCALRGRSGRSPPLALSRSSRGPTGVSTRRSHAAGLTNRVCGVCSSRRGRSTGRWSSRWTPPAGRDRMQRRARAVASTTRRSVTPPASRSSRDGAISGSAS